MKKKQENKEPTPSRSNAPSARKTARHSDSLKVFLPTLIIAAVALVVAFLFVEPAPPSSIRMATGAAEGHYHRVGLQYRKFLERERIELELVPTDGAEENLQQLEAPEGVDIAIVQGGLGEPAADEGIVSLASLYLEPLWVFHRLDRGASRLTEFRGRRVAVGLEGSGSRALADLLLTDCGIEAETTTLLPLSAAAATKSLRDGSIDAALFVASIDTPIVGELLATPGVHLMSLERAEAYTRRHRFLSRVELPMGTVDPATDLPPHDTILIAPAATLLARAELHPALMSLLLQAATETHSRASVLQAHGEFPSPKYLRFPLPKEAVRYFKSGPPFLQRYLPFWAANLIDRLKFMILPLLTLLIPLFKIVPPTYRWKVRSKIYRWYGELEAAEKSIAEDASEANVNRQLDRLATIEKEIEHVSVPLSYADEAYHLRLHLDLVRRKVRSAASTQQQGDAIS